MRYYKQSKNERNEYETHYACVVGDTISNGCLAGAVFDS